MKNMDLSNMLGALQESELEFLDSDSVIPAPLTKAEQLQTPQNFTEQLQTEIDSPYRTIQLGNRTISVRKWKVKDRIKLRNALLSETNDKKRQELIMRILVFGCIKDEIGLNSDELEYVFASIRELSIGNEIKFQYICTNPECSKNVESQLKISDILRPQYGVPGDIITDNVRIEYQDIQNHSYYNKKLKETNYSSAVDLILHIKTLNGSKMKESELFSYFEELDTDVMDKILDIWDNMRFSLDRTNTLVCPHCQTENIFEFDEIPNLIPPNWFKR